MNKIGIFVLVTTALICIATFTFFKFHHGSRKGSLDEQMISFLQNYIKINTTHPKPDYKKAINFLKEHAQKDSFEYQEVKLPSGNTVFIITYQGQDSLLPSIALNHHMDVVPANDEKNWIKPPFTGEIYNGEIIGRGTQDMKGIGTAHYFAIKKLKDNGIVPKRTVHIFAVPDEEVGGFKGTKEFVKTDAFKKLNIGFLIDEGHASGINDTLDIKVAERKPIQIKITSKGNLAHSSHLNCKNAIHNLINLLENFVEIHNEQQSKTSMQQPGELLSCNITSLTAGIRKEDGHIALNMVPDIAEATIDIRVPPTIKKQDIINKINNLIKQFDSIEYQILAQADEEPEISNYNTTLYKALRKTIEQFNLKVQPHYFEASSDLRFYQTLGIDSVGLTPFAIEDNIHGTNESVPVNELIRAREIIFEFLKEF